MKENNTMLAIIIIVISISAMQIAQKLDIIIQRLDVQNCFNLNNNAEAFEHCINSINE